LLHDSEKDLEHSTVEINDSCTHVVGDQPVEKSHLAAGVTDVSNCRNARQVIGQLRAFVGQVERCYRSIIDDIELSEQPRNQSLSNATTWRTNDVEWGGLVGHTMVRLATAHLAASSRGPSIGTPVSFYSVPTRIGHAVLSCKPKLQRATPRMGLASRYVS